MKKFFSILSGTLLLSAAATAPAAVDRTPSSTSPPIISWQAPASYKAPSSGRTALTDLSTPMPFVPVTPCRQYDSRNSTVLVDNTPRTVTLTGAPCGIPATAVAVAVNITVFNITGAGSNGVFKVGISAPPPTSWINYPFSETQRANAGVLGLTGAGAIVVQVNQGAGSVDFLVDVFGWYGATTTSGAFTINAAGGYAILGENSTGIGVYGFTSGSGGWGVFGANTSDGIGVYGFNTGTGFGVKGLASGNTGVRGDFPAPPTGSDFQAGVAGESSTSWGVFAKTNTGCNEVTLRVNGAGVSQNEIDMGCSDAVAATLWGNAGVAAFSGKPGNFSVAGTLTKGGGAFKIDHPLDPENKYLYHSFVESPDMKNVYDGVVQLDARGEAVVVLPDYFEALNSDFRYQLTSIGRHSPIFIADEVAGNQFRIAGGRPGMRVSWQVTGIRKDAWANAHRIIPEVPKEQEMQGRYLHPAELGKSIDRGPAERPQSVVIQETQQK